MIFINDDTSAFNIFLRTCTVKQVIKWMNNHMQMICRWGYA